MGFYSHYHAGYQKVGDSFQYKIAPKSIILVEHKLGGKKIQMMNFDYSVSDDAVI